MKAVVYDAFGKSDVLRIAEMPKPEPGPEEVLVRLEFTSVNPVDWKLRLGYLKDMLPHDFPIIGGWDAAGTVEAVGSQVSEFKPGDRVYAYARKDRVHDGSYAEYIALHESALARVPDNITLEQAAAIPLVGLTAWQALFDFADLKTGETVLIQAGAGGVGGFAVQFAKQQGARVLTTASRRNHGYVRGLGANHVIDYNTEDVVQAVRKVASNGVDVVFDCAGGGAMEQGWAVLREGGRLVSIVETPSEDEAKRLQAKAGFVFVSPSGKQLEEIAKRLSTGGLKLPHIETHSVGDAARLQDENQSGHTRGKLVLRIDF